MRLIDITEDNWTEVIFLSTSKGMPTICEEFIASNALSIVQAQFEKTWTTKAIEKDGKIIGFTMYGYTKKQGYYELCRIMIDYKYQGNGYGMEAMKLVITEMQKIENCHKIYLSTDPENLRGKHIYEKLGFINTGKIIDEEELYVLSIYK
ncbi:GNAT family N-acetyltransferase [Anaerobacillus isosaccharinicus]|uniref:GNAT family N-acetyltransferase n=1 Tax=Anaerobacillus isosaccharinicus TaxID=1532552 RepID=A0A1S2LMU2_9BACI|nr:GNAT family N-acetyltransferase [Anaerobacillus isosaccharinicus]MBA5586213.1 GNAT family N-acetyltransferase [Anaerobacillus isosaccharinicus]QOY35528.1 GNAT family N-acetyltransferase [Anaerobacillus isosaccharinicus]